MLWGYTKPFKLLKELDSRTIAWWLAYDDIAPFGHDALHHLIAQNTWMLHRVNTTGESNLTINDLLGIEPPELTEDVVLAALKGFRNAS